MSSISPALKKCPTCGKKVPAEKKACSCGQEMGIVDMFRSCPACGIRLIAEAEGCRGCGLVFEKEDQSSSDMVRICLLCGTENASYVEKCLSCGWSVSDAEPVESGTVHYLLLSFDRRCCVMITREPVVVGRDHDACADYLEQKESVSREHLVLSVSENGELIATDISSYGTWLNGGRMTADSPVFAGDGDDFSLSGTGDEAEWASHFRVIKTKRQRGDFA